MRICCYTDTFLPLVGGAETVLDHLARRLAASGESVVVLAPRVRRSPRRDEPYPYAVRRYHRPLSKRLGTRLALPRLAAMHLVQPFDVLHCHSSYPPAYVARTFRRWFGVPFVVRPHGSDILPGRRIRQNPRVARRMCRALVEANAVIAQGEFLRRAIADLGVPPRRLHVIHNGVDLMSFARAGSPPHPRPYALGLGNLIQRKGFDILLRAYAKVDAPKPDLLVAGRGREERSLRRLVADLDLGQQVRFTGFVEGQAKVDLLRGAAFFVCPSRTEPFANVILEAFACGKAVVASSVDGNVELVEDGVRGLLFDTEQPQALAAAMRRLMDHPPLRARMGAAAMSFVRELDWAIIAERYLDLYRSVADRVRGADHRSSDA